MDLASFLLILFGVTIGLIILAVKSKMVSIEFDPETGKKKWDMTKWLYQFKRDPRIRIIRDQGDRIVFQLAGCEMIASIKNEEIVIEAKPDIPLPFTLQKEYHSKRKPARGIKTGDTGFDSCFDIVARDELDTLRILSKPVRESLVNLSEFHLSIEDSIRLRIIRLPAVEKAVGMIQELSKLIKIKPDDNPAKTLISRIPDREEQIEVRLNLIQSLLNHKSSFLHEDENIRILREASQYSKLLAAVADYLEDHQDSFKEKIRLLSRDEYLNVIHTIFHDIKADDLEELIHQEMQNDLNNGKLESLIRLLEEYRMKVPDCVFTGLMKIPPNHLTENLILFLLKNLAASKTSLEWLGGVTPFCKTETLQMELLETLHRLNPPDIMEQLCLLENSFHLKVQGKARFFKNLHKPAVNPEMIGGLSLTDPETGGNLSMMKQTDNGNLSLDENQQ